MVLVQEEHGLKSADNVVFLFELERWAFDLREQKSDVIESARDINAVVTIRGDDTVELLAIDGKRHFDIFDFLALVVGKEHAQRLSVAHFILLSYIYEKISLENLWYKSNRKNSLPTIIVKSI